MRIATNISAVIANNQLQKSEDKLTRSLARLSSGFKINHAADDAAGMAISLKMKLQIKGLNQSTNNASDGVSVIQTAEGAITEIQSMLARMKELSVQAANDSNTDDDREAIQKEIMSLNKEIDRISNDTEFNSQSLINGNLERRVYTRGGIQGVEQFECSENIEADEYGLTISADARQAVVKSGAVNISRISPTQAGTVSINGYNVAIEEGDDISTVMTKMSSAMSLLGGKCFATDGTNTSDSDYAGYGQTTSLNGNSWVFMTNEYGSGIELNIKCENTDLANALGLAGATDKDGIVAQGTDVKADFTLSSGQRVGFADTATIATSGNKITVKDVGDKTFVLKVPGNIAGTTWTDVSGNTIGIAQAGNVSSTVNSSVGMNLVQQVTDIGAMKVHVGANEDQYIPVEISEISTYKLELDELNVMTFENAGRTIEKVDAATARVSEIRSMLGAYENRIEHTQNNLATSNENMTAALSRMIDTDMAEEMTEYTSQNVLAQAGTSILSQANARPETVLQLLDH